MKAVLSFKEFGELIKSDKGIKAVMIIGAALIVLIALGGLFTSGTKKSAPAESSVDLSGYEARLEGRLAEILSQIEGIGSVRVMVTLDTAGKTEYGRSSDMVQSVTAPSVRGVIVVCDGGDAVIIKEKVINAVTGVFGISSARVSVSR